MRKLAAGVSLVIMAELLIGAPGGGDALADPVASASGRAAVERGIRGCASRNRRSAGLGPLRQSRALARAVGERVAIFDRAHRFVGLGENIAAGYRSATLTCREWMNSSGHKGNILNPTYTHLGVGFAAGGPYGRYYVQVFGATTSASSSHLK